MIEVAGLTQRYGAYTAVRDVEFQVAPGDVVGFLGPNGAGKTTTLKVIATYLAPSSGTVTVGGHDVASAPLAARACLGYLPEHCPLYDDMEVDAFLHFVGRIRGLDRRARREAIERATARCRLEAVRDRPIAELSKGYRQRVGLAHALLHDPPVVVLDEPTHGLDPNQVQDVRDLVRDLGRDRTVLFSSHILAEVEATCRRVLVLHEGRLVADADLDDLKRRTTRGAVILGLSDPPEPPLDALRALPFVDQAEPCAPGRVRVQPAPGTDDLAPQLFALAARNGWTLDHLAPAPMTLEGVFAHLTGGARA